MPVVPRVMQVWPAKYGGGREGIGHLVTCVSELLLVPLNSSSECCMQQRLQLTSQHGCNNMPQHACTMHHLLTFTSPLSLAPAGSPPPSSYLQETCTKHI